MAIERLNYLTSKTAMVDTYLMPLYDPATNNDYNMTWANIKAGIVSEFPTYAVQNNHYIATAMADTTANKRPADLIPAVTIDGHTLNAGDIVFLHNTTYRTEIGLYIVVSGGGPATRATYFDSGNEVAYSKITIQNGTTYAGTEWECVTGLPMTIGVTDLYFSRFYLPFQDVNTTGTPNFTKLGIGITPSIYDIDLGGNTSRTIGMTRNTTADTAGNELVIRSGGATVGATDKSGGRVRIAPGISTGMGDGYVAIMRNDRTQTTGTADNAQYEAIVNIPPKLLVDANPVGIFELTLPANKSCGGSFIYSIEVSNGTDFQSHTGFVNYAAVNKGGVYTTTISEASPASGMEISTVSTGTLSDAWTIATGTDKITIRCTADSSLAGITIFKLYGTIFNSSNQAITIL